MNRFFILRTVDIQPLQEKVFFSYLAYVYWECGSLNSAEFWFYPGLFLPSWKPPGCQEAFLCARHTDCSDSVLTRRPLWKPVVPKCTGNCNCGHWAAPERATFAQLSVCLKFHDKIHRTVKWVCWQTGPRREGHRASPEDVWGLFNLGIESTLHGSFTAITICKTHFIYIYLYIILYYTHNIKPKGNNDSFTLFHKNK
jgi:hypothetical protein